MHSLKELLQTGQIGPLVLGASSSTVMTELGDATDISIKTNPLLMRYGPIRLTFSKSPQERRQTLQEFEIDFEQHDELPATLNLSDWPRLLPPKERWFTELCSDNSVPYSLVGQGSIGKRFITASGVLAFVHGDSVQKLRVATKDLRSQPNIQMNETEEGTEAQLLSMIREAHRASDVQAYQAALLIGWAAVENVLRRTAARRGIAGRAGANPMLLIKELSVSGALTKEEASALEQLRQIRTAAAHGLASSNANANVVQALLTVLERIRSRLLTEQQPKAVSKL